MPQQEDPGLKFNQHCSPVKLACGPRPGQKESGQALWIIHAGGLQKRCLSPATLIPTGGGRLRPVEGPT